MEDYIEHGHCLHQELFLGHWKDTWMDDDFRTLKQMLTRGATLEEVLNTGFLRQEFPGVYSLPTFSRTLCDMIVAESENILKYAREKDIPIHRPNSMNKYGLVLNLIGMKDTLSELQQNYFQPISRLVFPIEGSAFSDHHTFIVSYETTRDKSLDMHTDDSDVTWNICLGKEGFTGSGLTFCGRMAEADHRQLQGHYSHTLGRAVLHLGHQRHGADNILSGERHNLIMWCKNEVYRNSDLFETRMRHYEKESGPPATQCLSYTHDRDYIAFKDYPRGKNPYSLDDSESEAEDEGNDDRTNEATHQQEPEKHQNLPWCPPSRFQYDGMFSQNKLMLIHFEKEVEKEEKKKKKRKIMDAI